MTHRLYCELETHEFLYHELEAFNGDIIILSPTSIEAESVDEIMRIKEIADKHHHITSWDGENIEIKRMKK